MWKIIIKSQINACLINIVYFDIRKKGLITDIITPD